MEWDRSRIKKIAFMKVHVVFDAGGLVFFFNPAPSLFVEFLSRCDGNGSWIPVLLQGSNTQFFPFL